MYHRQRVEADVRDADEWAKSLNGAEYVDDDSGWQTHKIAALIREAQLDGVRHVRDTIEMAHFLNPYVKSGSLDTLKYDRAHRIENALAEGRLKDGSSISDVEAFLGVDNKEANEAVLVLMQHSAVRYEAATYTIWKMTAHE